jgi:hypothetical protein
MRSFVLILCTFLLLIGAFAVYWLVQPQTVIIQPPRERQLASGPAVTTRQTLGVLGSGQRGWVKSFNSAGDLASEFYAERYDPQPDSTILVEKPQAKIYLPHGQYIHLTGETGVVAMDPSDTPDNSLAASGPMAPPKRGELHQVNIALFPSQEATSPTLTVELNNVAFDMQTFRIYTEAYREEKTHKLIEADEVPVQVYGVDYEFSGRGLVIRWNELRGRLELLEIAHGDKLIIKNPNKLMSPVVAAGSTSDVARRWASPTLHSAIAATDDAAIADALATQAATRPATRPAQPVYRAIFHDRIRITQDQTPLATGDRLEIDFLPKQGEQKSPAAPQTVLAAEPPASAPATAPTTASTTPSALANRGPITVYWTGPLRVEPLPDHTQPAPPPGQAIVRLFGAPVHLQQETGQIECARLQYHTADQTITLDQFGDTPVTLQDARGSTIHAQRMELDRRQHRAILSGTGSAQFRNPDPSDNQTITARWSDSCTLQLDPAGGDAMVIQSAKLQGAVDVQTPELKLQSDGLELTMASGTTSSTTHPADPGAIQLQRVLATGDVHCVLSSPQGEQTLRAQRLDVLAASTDAGRFYPRTVRADGQVQAVSVERTLLAGHVEVTLAPATRPTSSTRPDAMPALEIQELLAQDNVLVKSADGATASADQIRVLGNGPDQRILLLGQPLAKITSQDSTLSGPLIEVLPQKQRFYIRGAGTIHARQAAKGSSPAQVVDISWMDGAYVDGQTNLGEATGKVHISSPGPDGSSRVASAGRIKLHLVDVTTAPTTGPSTQPSQLDLMGHKSLQTVELQGDVEIKSELLADGKVLRGMNLHADAAEYHVVDEWFVVPGPGRMLAEDHRPATGATRPAEPLSPDAGDFRGMTAVQWQKKFLFSPKEHQAQLIGAVRIVQEPANDPARRRELSADQVTILFSSAPATAPTTGESARMQLDSVRARGSIYFKTEGIECRAARVEFDAARHLLHAAGDATQRGEMLDGQGLSRGGFDELWFDTQSQDLQITGAHGQVRP